MIPYRLYFFPAVLPLAAMLPWLLTAFGAMAGVVLRLSKRKRWGLAILFFSLVAASVLLYPRATWWVNSSGTKLTAPDNFPKIQISTPLPSEPKDIAREYHGPLKEHWSIEIQRRALSSPLRAGSLIVFGTWEGTVDAYSVETGALVWSIAKREPIFAMTVASKDLLLVGEGLHSTASSSLTAVRLPDGKILWQREFKGHVESAPKFSAEKNRIWMSAGPSGLWCLNSLDGSVVWHAAVGHVDATPLLVKDLVLFASQPDEGKKESVFWALSQVNGTEVWKLPLPGQPWGSPILGREESTLLTSTGLGQVGVSLETDHGWAHKLSLDGSNKLLWTSELAGNPIETNRLLSQNNVVIYLLTKGQIVALHSEDGTRAWTLPLSGPVQADPALLEKSSPPLLAVFETSGMLTLSNAKNGNLLEKVKLDAGGSSSPLFLPDGLLVATPYKLVRYRW